MTYSDPFGLMVDLGSSDLLTCDQCSWRGMAWEIPDHVERQHVAGRNLTEPAEAPYGVHWGNPSEPRPYASPAASTLPVAAVRGPAACPVCGALAGGSEPAVGRYVDSHGLTRFMVHWAPDGSTPARCSGSNQLDRSGS